MSLFWSIRPFEEVMSGFEPPVFEEVTIGTATMVISGQGGDRRIERLISPIPSDYLKPEWQPGCRWMHSKSE